MSFSQRTHRNGRVSSRISVRNARPTESRELKQETFLIHGRQPEVTIPALQSMRMRLRFWHEVTDVRRGCLPFVLFRERHFNKKWLQTSKRTCKYTICIEVMFVVVKAALGAYLSAKLKVPANTKGGVTLVNLQRQLATIPCCAKNYSSVTPRCGQFFAIFAVLQRVASFWKRFKSVSCLQIRAKNMRFESALQVDRKWNYKLVFAVFVSKEFSRGQWKMGISAYFDLWNS